MVSDTEEPAIGQVDLPDGWEENRPMIGGSCVAGFRDEAFDWFVDVYVTTEDSYEYMAELTQQVGGDQSFIVEEVHTVYFNPDETDDALSLLFDRHQEEVQD